MIKIGKIDKKLIFPVFAGILYFPFYFISERSAIKSHYLMNSLCSAMGMSLSIIPYLISKYNMKKSMSNKNLNKLVRKTNTKELELVLIYNKISYDIKRYKHLYIFLSSITDFLQTLIAAITVKGDISINFWLSDIIFLSILSYFILNIKLLKHQIFSLTIIVISGVFVDFLFGSLREAPSNIKYVLLRLFCEFAYSFSLIINKYCMDYKFSSPYEVCFFVGIFTFFFYSISLIISSNISCNLDFCYVEDKNKKKYFDKFEVYINNLDKTEVFYFILEMIFLSLINILSLLTIKFFTPFHSVIILVIGRINFTIDKLFKGKIELEDIIYIIFLLFISFGLLIYFEIIILNFCGIQRYTRDNIEKRGILDADWAINDDNCSQEESLNEINGEKENNLDESNTSSNF